MTSNVGSTVPITAVTSNVPTVSSTTYPPTPATATWSCVSVAYPQASHGLPSPQDSK